MDTIEELYKALTPITQDLRRKILAKCKEADFDGNIGQVPLDESLINLIEIKSILIDAIEKKKLVQLPITIQKQLALSLTEITKFTEGIFGGTNHVENIVNAIEKINVLVWQYGFHNLSDQILGYLNKMNEIKKMQTELTATKDAADGTIQKKTEIEKMIAIHAQLVDGLRDRVTGLEEKEGKITEVLKGCGEKANEIDNLKKAVDESVVKVGEALKSSESAEGKIREIEKEGIEFSGKIKDYIETVEDVTKKAEVAQENATKVVSESKTAADSLNTTYAEKGEALVKKVEQEYDETLEKWNKEHGAILERIEDLLPRALTTGLSYAYSDKKKIEVTDYNKFTGNFKWSIGGLVAVSLIPFAFSIVRLIQEIPLVTVVFDLPRVVLAILPLYIPVVWLAYSANKKMNLSKRLIEEYTHKEVLSKTFEGLSNQINGLRNDSIAKDLRLKLLYNVLEVSSENPGKLISDYDKSDHPFMEALEKSAKLASAVHKLSDIPGFGRIVAVLDKKAKEILEDEVKKSAEGMEALEELQKNDKKRKD